MVHFFDQKEVKLLTVTTLLVQVDKNKLVCQIDPYRPQLNLIWVSHNMKSLRGTKFFNKIDFTRKLLISIANSCKPLEANCKKNASKLEAAVC